MSDLFIRPMREEDLPRVMEIEQASMSLTWSQGVWMGELRKSQIASHFVALRQAQGERNEEIIGYAGCWIVVDEATIVNIAVDPAWRRRGIGNRLLETLLTHARDQGAQLATLEVRRTNEAAIKLYERHGFQMIAMRKNYYQNPLEDAYVYWLNPIPAASSA